MLVIRYQRVGRKNDASFRIVVTEHTTGPKSGKHVEQLGSYNPKTKAVTMKKDRIEHWMSVGAQVSDSVHNLLVKEGVIEGSKINVLPKKSPIAKEVEEAEAEAPAPAAEEGAEAPAEEAVEEAAPEEAPATEEAPAEEAPAEEEKKEEA
ncbi:MAG: 30S ribosomal protein S16 [Patescibacteria group bacterium UBA2103]